MAVFDMCMSIRVHVRSWSTAPLISGCEVSKQKQKIVFGMDSLGKIPRYLAGEIKYTRPRACRFTERERERAAQRDRHREKQPTGKQPS